MNTQINDGGPAFPLAVEAGVLGSRCGPHAEWGMSLRDWFAGQALAGMFSDTDTIASAKLLGQRDSVSATLVVCEAAYDLADAMLAARQKKGGS